jgi:hypothetical protein
MVPTTIVDVKTLPPISAPMPIIASPTPENDVKDENISGDPFPKAKNVTPAKLYDKLNFKQIAPSVGDK